MKKIVNYALFGSALMLTFISASFAEANYTSVCVHNASGACKVAFDYNYGGSSDPTKYTVYVSSKSTTTVPIDGHPNMWVINAHCQSDNKSVTGIVMPGQTVYCDGGAIGKVTCSITNKWDCGSNT